MRSRYFDHNATTPIAEEVYEAMAPYFKEFYGNPSSAHHLGQISNRALRQARKQVAGLLGAADEKEILFTSCGTESNNTAIRAALAASGRRQVITSSVEHSSVLKLCRQLANEGCEVHFLKVDRQGQLDLEELDSVVTERTAVVSLMMANNETGILFPIEKIGKIVKDKGAFFHVDGVQAVGKCPLDLKNSPIDLFSLSAHKFYGPKGMGALYVKSAFPFHPLIFGGSQERGRRAGTENLPGIVGLGKAGESAEKNLSGEIGRLRKLRDDFETKVQDQIPEVRVNGGGSPRIPNTSNLLFKQIEAEPLIFALDQKGICVSAGSACLSGSMEVSHVLRAMGLSEDEAGSCVRFSFGRHTTPEDIHFLISELKEEVSRLRVIPAPCHSRSATDLADPSSGGESGNPGTG